MKIEDCQTVNEFFGVEEGDTIWVEDKEFIVAENSISGVDISMRWNTPALVGCLTGQLKWSRHEPMTDEEENILREIAAWFPSWQTLRLEKDGDIGIFTDYKYFNYYFGLAAHGSKAYTVLAPILEKHGEIDLDDYRREQQ